MHFPEHPLRRTVSEEVHARPYGQIWAPAQVSFLAYNSGETGAKADREHTAELCRHFQVDGPAPTVKHFTADLGPAHLKWERHTEFSTYHFRKQAPFAEPFSQTPIELIPERWRAAIPGELVAAAHIALEPAQTPERDPQRMASLFDGNTYIGSRMLGGKAKVWTDFRIHEDGFGRILICDAGLNGRQAGRLVQRLMEVEVYRIMAMFAFPIALDSRPKVATAERELSALVHELSVIDGPRDEQGLLGRLTRLAAQIEALSASTNYRFSATRAYYRLVQRRVEELREERIEGLQPPGEFLFRRLEPAMQTCENVIARQASVADRIAQTTELLRTRVTVALEKQNQALLQSMDKRARLQLRLQETVEGLSVAAISYYVLGIIAYGFKALEDTGVAVNPDIAVGAAIPLVLGLAWYGVRRIHRTLGERGDEG